MRNNKFDTANSTPIKGKKSIKEHADPDSRETSFIVLTIGFVLKKYSDILLDISPDYQFCASNRSVER
jgi:hypothetical protein